MSIFFSANAISLYDTICIYIHIQFDFSISYSFVYIPDKFDVRYLAWCDMSSQIYLISTIREQMLNLKVIEKIKKNKQYPLEGLSD